MESKYTRLSELHNFITVNSYNKECVIEIGSLEKIISEFNIIERELLDVETLWSLSVKLSDFDSMNECYDLLKVLVPKIDKFKLEQLFNNDDLRNAIVSINSGAGGQEAQDWARILFRMYQRWAENNGFDVEIISIVKSNAELIKNVDFIVSGKYAYGLLKLETGVHRLVRNSPFDAKNSRHTSFSSVFVSPEIDDNININIKESDLKIDRFCSSGPGGQNVNKLETAIRITHLPTKIVVSCQDNRYQHQNEETAKRILKSKLYELELQKKRDEMKKNHDNMPGISWGNQVRSYFLQPKVIIKDHRTNIEKYNSDRVLGGDIDDFIYGALLENALQSN